MLRAVQCICVTGASGFLGRHLCDYFRRQGSEVRALMRHPERYPFREPGIKPYKCDLPCDIDHAAFEGADIVIHCAYTTRQTSPEEAFSVNYLGTKAIYGLSRTHQASRFVFISSTAAHAGAESYYGRSKCSLERLFDESKDLVIRPGLILGAGDNTRFAQMIRLIHRVGVVPILRGSRPILQTIHIDDLCKAIDLALQKRLTGTFVVAEPQGLPITDFFQLIAAHFQRRCVFMPLPIRPTLAVLRVIEALGIPFPLTTESLLGLKQLTHMPSSDDLATIGIDVMPAEESVALCLNGKDRKR
jgi:nucleoside-diphosphate-sugar epimerase